MGPNDAVRFVDFSRNPLPERGMVLLKRCPLGVLRPTSPQTAFNPVEKPEIRTQRLWIVWITRKTRTFIPFCPVENLDGEWKRDEFGALYSHQRVLVDGNDCWYTLR